MEKQTFRNWTLHWSKDNPEKVVVWKGLEDVGVFTRDTLVDLHFLVSQCFGKDCQCECYDAGYTKAQETVGDWRGGRTW